MNRLTALLVIVSLSHLTSLQAQDSVDVQVVDFAGLQKAIVDANERTYGILTSIRVPADIFVPADGALPPIEAYLQIRGGKFHGGGDFSQSSVGEDTTPAKLFLITSSGRLNVEGSVFIDFKRAIDGPVLFENAGDLTLDGVTFTSNVGYPQWLGHAVVQNETAIIHNTSSGNLFMDHVRVQDSGSDVVNGSPKPLNGFLANEGNTEIQNSQLYLSQHRWEQPLYNSGVLRITNSSFVVRNELDFPSLDLVLNTASGQIESVNSVYEGFTGDWCANVLSLGHNTNSSPDCSWAVNGDVVGVSAGLIRRELAGSRFNLEPSAASSVVDSANDDWCPENHAVLDGNGDGTIACDRGAVELVPSSLAEGGINGLYYTPENDGHYVYVLQTDYTTLVMWNTFDRDGEQAWIFGTGDLIDGRSVITEAYMNRTGGFIQGSLVSEVDTVYWGQIEVDMETCTKGDVSYHSVLPEFGSGQFPIQRLAYVKQVGCVDPE